MEEATIVIDHTVVKEADPAVAHEDMAAISDAILVRAVDASDDLQLEAPWLAER